MVKGFKSKGMRKKMGKFIVIQSRQVSKELHCFGYSSVKQRAVCIMNVWGNTEILPLLEIPKSLLLSSSNGSKTLSVLRGTLRGRFEADSIFHSSYRVRRVCHIEPFQLKFAEGLGIYPVTLSAIFRSDRM